MEVKIQSIHFDATEKLQAFIQKKMEKIGKYSDDVLSAQVVLKVEKPEATKNKNTSIMLFVKKDKLFCEKVCDTFEEGIDLCVETLLRQLDKYKEKKRSK